MKPRHRHHVAGLYLSCPWDCCRNQNRVISISAAVLELRNLHILFVISNCRLLCQQERISINGLVNLKIQFSPCSLCLYLVDI